MKITYQKTEVIEHFYENSLEEADFYYLVEKYSLVGASWNDVVQILDGKMEDIKIFYRHPNALTVTTDYLIDFILDYLSNTASEFDYNRVHSEFRWGLLEDDEDDENGVF